MAKTVSEVFVETLIEAGVRRSTGCGGLAQRSDRRIRKSEEIECCTCGMKETSAFAAGADAQVNRTTRCLRRAVWSGKSPLINGLYDCHRTRVPVLAIAAQIPSSRSERLFPGDSPEHLFKDCSHYCELVSQPEKCRACSESPCALPSLGKRGGRYHSGDIASATVNHNRSLSALISQPQLRCLAETLEKAAKVLNEPRPSPFLAAQAARSTRRTAGRGGG